MILEIPEFKIRSSAGSKIMAGNVGPSTSQLLNIEKMELREKPMTAPMQEKYDKDIKARDEPPELPAGAKTYCKSWLKEQTAFYARRKEIKSKYLDKGNICEDIAIRFLNELHLEDYAKNEKHFEDKWITGTPDIIKLPLTRDTKCSWDASTFPIFEDAADSAYIVQGHCYMYLTGARRHSVDYCLIDTPMHLIEREAKFAAYASNISYDDLLPEFIEKMTFDHVDSKLRVKSFAFDYDPGMIERLKVRVELCREYIKTLVKKVS